MRISLSITILVGMLIPALCLAQTSQPTFLGQWNLEVVPIESSQSEGAVAASHTLTFTPATVTIEGPLGSAFGPASYETEGADYRIILRHDKLGTVLWAGEMASSTTTRGLVRWTRSDGKILTYRFDGRRQ